MIKRKQLTHNASVAYPVTKYDRVRKMLGTSKLSAGQNRK